MNSDFIDYFKLKSNKKKLIDIQPIRVVFALIEIDFIFLNSKWTIFIDFNFENRFELFKID